VYSGGCDSRCLDYRAFAGRRYTRLAFGLGIVGRYLKELLGIMEELTGWPNLFKETAWIGLTHDFMIDNVHDYWHTLFHMWEV
jgi:hypothetical protein